MTVVDSHCHASEAWYEPVESLLFQMDRYGVQHAVLVQMMGQTDNRYQLDCQRRYPGRFASVVVVNTTRSEAADELGQLAAQGAAGVRLQPAMRSPGDDPLAIWRAADQHQLTVSCLGDASAFASASFAEIAITLPSLRLVIEHLGGLGRPVGEAYPAELEDRIFGLVRYPNVFMKLSGLGEFCRRTRPMTEPFPFEQPIPPLLQRAYDAFGADRLMWGSDFPPVSGREGYGGALRWPREQLSHLSAAEGERIFGGTALSVFPVR